jgi:uncharacterized Fe-S cluster-containing radical SAM superfamily protein
MISSKQKLENKHQIHDIFTVKVIERVDHESWIVSMSGTLIQIKNKTHRDLKEGAQVRVRVKSLDPVQLEFV